MQFGLFESRNNLDEIQSKLDSRNSLLIGDFIIQNSHNINITGKELRVGDLKLKKSLDRTDLFLNSIDAEGNIDFNEFAIPQWAYSNEQVDVFLSRFSNDGFAYKKGFNYDVDSNTFIFNENLINLKNRPTFFNVASNYGYKNDDFIENNKNLSTCSSIDVKSNLDIGNISEFNNDDVIIEKLVLHSNLIMSYLKDNVETFIRLNNDNNFESKNFTFPLLFNEELIDSDINLTSSRLTSNIFSNLDYKVYDTTQSNLKFFEDNFGDITYKLSNDVFLSSDEYLREFESMENSGEKIVSNLGLGDIIFQDSNDVNIGTVNLNNLFLEPNKVFYDKLYDRNEKDGIKHLGFITTKECVSYEHLSNNKSNYEVGLVALSNAIGQNLFDFSDNLEKNLGKLGSVNEARCNLNLHTVSISGKLIDIDNRPAYLSEMNNNTGYLIKYNNLNDVVDAKVARSNLGIKDMALEDADNIGGSDFFPLGTLGFKMDSNECVFDDVYVDEGDLYLKTPDYVSEKNADFLTVQKDHDNLFYKYRLEQLQKCDTDYFTSRYLLYPNDYVRVAVNDLRDYLGKDENPGYVLGDHFVPSAKFMFDKFKILASNVLTHFEIPIKHWTRVKLFVDDVINKFQDSNMENPFDVDQYE